MTNLQPGDRAYLPVIVKEVTDGLATIRPEWEDCSAFVTAEVPVGHLVPAEDQALTAGKVVADFLRQRGVATEHAEGWDVGN